MKYKGGPNSVSKNHISFRCKKRTQKLASCTFLSWSQVWLWFQEQTSWRWLRCCNSSIQLRTAVIFSVVPMPAPYAFRSVIGIRWTRSSFLLWRSWVAQFSSLHTAVGRLRKLIGYLKTTSDFCLNGRAASIGFLRRSDSDWSDTNHTGDRLNVGFLYSAWQIAMWLGPGKLKHVAGKLLWIQEG